MRRHYFIMPRCIRRITSGSSLGRNLSHNRDKNFFSNSPQISPKHRHSPLDSRLWMRGDVPLRIPARIRRCTLACICSVNRWALVGAAPTERKSRIRNNEPREPRGLTRAVKSLWLYSAASLLFSFVLARFFFFSLRTSHPFSSLLRSAFDLLPLGRVSFLFLISRYTLLHAMLLDSVNFSLANSTFALSFVDNDDNSINCEFSEYALKEKYSYF